MRNCCKFKEQRKVTILVAFICKINDFENHKISTNKIYVHRFTTTYLVVLFFIPAVFILFSSCILYIFVDSAWIIAWFKGVLLFYYFVEFILWLCTKRTYNFDVKFYRMIICRCLLLILIEFIVEVLNISYWYQNRHLVMYQRTIVTFYI